MDNGLEELNAQAYQTFVAALVRCHSFGADIEDLRTLAELYSIDSRDFDNAMNVRETA